MPPPLRRLSTLALAAALLGGCGGGGLTLGGGGGGGGSCGAIQALAPGAAEPDEVVVMLRRTNPHVPVTALPPDLLTHGLTVIAQFGTRPIWRLRVAPGDTVAAAIGRLQGDARVLWAEPNLQTQSPESRRCSVWAIGQASDFQAQWAPQALQLAAAHSSSVGAGVRVAVLDTGLDYSHPEFAGRIGAGVDFVDPGGQPAERGTRDANPGYGHGTHVAGLVLLAAPQARIMPVRVLDADGQGNAWVLAEALAWAVDPDGNPNTDDGAHVVNFSLGSLQRTRLLEIATRIASCDLDDDDEDDDDAFTADDEARCNQRHGAVVIAAAGNTGSPTEQQFPAAEIQLEGLAGALAVTASNAQGRRADFGNHGPWVQIAAPGEGITSTVPGGGWGTWSGTSMAAPLAAGVAALVIASGPGPTSDPDPLRSWAPTDVVQRLRNGSAPLCPGSQPPTQIDARGALDNAQAPPLPCR
jgi:subtilisin family serine protease